MQIAFLLQDSVAGVRRSELQGADVEAVNRTSTNTLHSPLDVSSGAVGMLWLRGPTLVRPHPVTLSPWESSRGLAQSFSPPPLPPPPHVAGHGYRHDLSSECSLFLHFYLFHHFRAEGSRVEISLRFLTARVTQATTAGREPRHFADGVLSSPSSECTAVCS